MTGSAGATPTSCSASCAVPAVAAFVLPWRCSPRLSHIAGKTDAGFSATTLDAWERDAPSTNRSRLLGAGVSTFFFTRRRECTLITAHIVAYLSTAGFPVPGICKWYQNIHHFRGLCGLRLFSFPCHRAAVRHCSALHARRISCLRLRGASVCSRYHARKQLFRGTPTLTGLIV